MDFLNMFKQLWCEWGTPYYMTCIEEFSYLTSLCYGREQIPAIIFQGQVARNPASL